MKKIAILGLALLMLVLTLTSCGNDTPSLDKSEQKILSKRNDDNGYLCFTALEPGSTIAMWTDENAPAISLQYSTNQKNWQEFIVGQTEVRLENVNDRVYFRGNNPNGLANYMGGFAVGNTFKLTGRLAGGGNIMCLIDSENFKAMTEVPDYAFTYLFSGCESLVTAPNLPATNLSDSCYREMFSACTNLEIAPVLPATKLAKKCYRGMFESCFSLTVAPELPATELAEDCYGEMFADCNSLKAAPELPATKLAVGCYESMLRGCGSLTTAPELPATKLAEECYEEMFEGCGSLTTAPELQATELAEGCYEFMFVCCNALKSVEVGFESFTDIPYGVTDNWLGGVAENGTFIWAGDDIYTERGADTIPEGWTIVSAR